MEGNSSSVAESAGAGLRPGASDSSRKSEWRELNIGGVTVEHRSLNLRDIGFVGRVSDEARAEIRANERRAQSVLSTAHLYWFGGR